MCPDYDSEGEQLIVLTTDTNRVPEWNEEVRADIYSSYQLKYDLENSQEKAYAGENMMFVANELVDYQSGVKIQLPDSLKECNFGNRTNSLICSVIRPDSVYNSYLDSTFYIQNATSLLYEIDAAVVQRFFIIDNQKILTKTDAEFINAERYSISSFHSPLYDHETEMILFQESAEIRELVFNSSDSVINDVLFYRELNQMKYEDSTVTKLLSYGQLNPKEAIPSFAISEQKQKYTYSYKGKIYIQDYLKEEGELIGEGKNPVFFSNGEKLFYTTFNSTIAIYYTSNHETLHLSDNEAIISAAAQKDSEKLYYLTDSGIKYYDSSNNKQNDLIEFSTYIDSREMAQSQGYSLYLTLDPLQLFFTPKSNKLSVLIASYYSSHYDCE